MAIPMRSSRAVTFALLLFAAGNTLAALPAFLEDSLALDRAYIPALMISGDGNAAQALVAHDAYAKAWEIFAVKHRSAKPGDLAWRALFRFVDRANAAAREALVAGKVADAHAQLDEVGHELSHRRQAMGFGYQPDRLLEYREMIGHLRTSVEAREAGALGAPVLATMRKQLAKARTQWQAVKHAQWDPADYGLAGERLAGYRAAVAAEDKALDALAAALDAGDRARIEASVRALAPPFAAAYGAFGAEPRPLPRDGLAQ